MTKSIRRRYFAISMLAAVASLAAIPSQAQDEVVYTPGEGFEVVWTLEPRSDPAHFTHGPTFGTRSVFPGMDFDGDGNLEFLFTGDETISDPAVDPGYLDLYLYENNGDNSYEYVWHYTHPDPSNSYPAVTWGDLDDDGLWEIYLGIPTLNDANDLFIFEQDDQKVFPTDPTAKYNYERAPELDFRPAGLQIADVDDDGVLELLTVSRTANARELVVISAVGAIDAFATFNIEFEAGNAILQGGSIYDVMVVDFDDDGLKEIWVNTWDDWSMSIFEATGPDTYELQVDLDAVKEPENDPGSTNAHNLYFADLDGNDGKLEGYFPMSDGNLWYIPNTDDVSTITGDDIVRVGRYGTFTRGASMGDIDRDGLTDFVVALPQEEKVKRIEFQGAGSPADSANYVWSTILDSSDSTTTVVVADEYYYPPAISNDLDGDGKNEVLLTNLHASDAGQHVIIILEYTGSTNPAVEPGPAVLDGFTLHSTYPNPFSNSTTVTMELEHASDITLEVFDLTGRRVKVLESGTRAAGLHEVEFFADHLPDGLYIIRLQTPSGSLTRTAMLVR